ncbi:hypothetical protein [Hymenobacter canadensis]|uniref:Uncharacterized protein n=1 Tax=Hymenobacter canadensis TaxID=2999067 RepID=A0ABY7LRX7_9BACT|nr:hypothetical protein [Hymenobacter canadensis]WBA43172.1 hypothetical protein O3303_06305 [Hymenobacter canadensis]
MKAKTSFYFQSEMWPEGVVKDVNAHNAKLLEEIGLVEEERVEIEVEIETKPLKPARETKPAKRSVEKK